LPSRMVARCATVAPGGRLADHRGRAGRGAGWLLCTVVGMGLPVIPRRRGGLADREWVVGCVPTGLALPRSDDGVRRLDDTLVDLDRQPGSDRAGDSAMPHGSGRRFCVRHPDQAYDIP